LSSISLRTVTIYYVNSTLNINQQLLKVKSCQHISAAVSHHQAKNGT